MTTVQYDFDDLDGLIADVRNLSNAPSFRVIRGLERTLRNAFLDTQAKVHVITSSLKGSGRSSSEFVAPTHWEGHITYGGPSPGFPNDPVVYAIYEMARGGEHDFFRDLPMYDPLFVQAILSQLDDD